MENVNIFDASLLDSGGGQMTKDEFVAELTDKLSDILKRRFPGNPQRQRIRVYRDRINFAAPCCGDSAHDNSKKRGNIILEGQFRNLYKCHNCGRSMSLSGFFREYGLGLSMNAMDYVNTGKSEGSSKTLSSSVYGGVTTGKMESLYNEDEIDSYALDRDVLKSVLSLEECNVHNNGHMYLVNRCQFKFDRFLYSKKDDMLYVLNLTRTGKIIGMQTRPLRYKSYKTYNLSNIYRTFMNRDDVGVPEYIDTLSMVFNILLMDYRVPVTIVEGPMDSFLVRNCIALCGGGKHLDFPFSYRYLFDSDKTGRKYTIEKLESGCSVFMWDRYKKDVGLPEKSKWDINDAVIWSYRNGVKLPRVDGYFSNDKMDVMYI